MRGAGLYGPPRRRSGSERIENVCDVLTLRVDRVAHHIHIVAAAELERSAGAALLREANQDIARLRVDDFAAQLRSGRTRAVSGEVALRARARREIDDRAANDERLRRFRR